MTKEIRWLPTVIVSRSRFLDDVWVPFDSLDTPNEMPLHAGPLKQVQEWAEQYVREEHEKFDLPVPALRWSKHDKDSYTLMFAQERAQERD